MSLVKSRQLTPKTLAEISRRLAKESKKENK